jgi:glycosyltransferase involved in cell wall biosynthesis
LTDPDHSTTPADTMAGRGARIALLGPVRPYRGGIAQYTTQLKDALGRIATLTTLSFSRQYPQWLYPGQSDKEPGEQEAEPDVKYVIDALSPVSWHRAASRIIAAGCESAVLTWWTLFWAPAFAYIAWRLRRHGIRTSFLCHNLSDHDSKGMKSAVSRWLLSSADSYIVHASEQRDVLLRLYPAKPVLQRPLPIFDHFPAPSAVLPKRGRLEVLFFGFIRPYKGLDVLLDAMKLLGDPDVYLTIAGEMWGQDERISSASEIEGANVETCLQYVNSDVAAAYFERADIVVLPYLTATGSGVVALAYHYRKPVLASKIGGLEDVVVQGRTGWLVTPGSASALAGALAAIDRETASSLKQAIGAFVDEHSWDKMAGAVLKFSVSPVDKGRSDPCR